MNRTYPLVLAAAALVLIGATAGFLARVQASYRLGEPGLVLSPEPLLDEDGKAVGTNSVSLPEQVLNYESRVGTVSSAELGYLPEDTVYGRRFYQGPDGFNLMLTAVLMGRDRTSIHKPQICLVGQGWTIEQSDELTIEVQNKSGATARMPVMRLIASRTFRDASGASVPMKAVYVYWFATDGLTTARHGQRMWWMTKGLLTEGRLQRWAYVSCLAVGPPGSEEALYRRMETFLSASAPMFHTASTLASLSP